MSEIDKSEKISIVTSLVQELMSLMNVKSSLKVAMSNFSVFDKINTSFQARTDFGWENELSEGDKFDLVLGDLPLGMNKRGDYKFGVQTVKIRQIWIEILKSVKYLSGNGTAIFLVEPSGFGSSDGMKLEDALNSEGYYVKAIFNAPDDILQPVTSITPVFILITKSKSKSIFIAELLNESQSQQVARNYFSGIAAGDLNRGMEIEFRQYYGFHHVKIMQQIEKLETQYKEYERHAIGEIANEIHYVKPGYTLVERENSVYPQNWQFTSNNQNYGCNDQTP